MKDLLCKELRLSLHPAQLLFLALSAMVLIPSYPYYVIFLYTCLGVYFMFLSGRENRDVFYTALLPVRKCEVVRARVLSAALIELVQVLVTVPLAVLSVRMNPGTNTAGIEPNVAFFGLVFVMLGGFNLIFLPSFYQTALRTGRGLIWGSVFILLYFIAVESAAQYVPSPVSAFLDTTEPAAQLRQLPLLLCGLLLWIGLTALASRISERRFERVDL